MNAPLDARAVRRQLYEEMAPLNLTPLWEVLHALVPPAPRTPCVAAHWGYDAVRPFLMRSGEAITAEEAVRRVLILDVGKFEKCVFTFTIGRCSQRSIEQRRVALCCKVTQEATRIR